MGQTIEHLIDKLQLAIFNVDGWGQVSLSLEDAKAIGKKLQLLIEENSMDQLWAEMGLTRSEIAIYRTLVAEGAPVSAQKLLEASGCSSLESLWVHKRRLVVKLRHHRRGDIDTIRGKGYMLLGGEG
jgi:DNA-binding response OmpR family regulator